MNVEDIVARLGEATDAELSEALAAITVQAGEVGPENTQDNVDKLEALAGARDAILGQQAANAELAAKGDAARAAFTVEPAVTEPPAAEPLAAEPPAVTEPPETDPAAVTAGAAKLGDIGKVRGADKAPAAVALSVSARTVAVTSSPDQAAGVQLDRRTLAEALSHKWAQIRATGGSGREYVARVEFEYPEERKLLDDSTFSQNAAKIDGATSQEAITAAGGFCAPLENLYDINVLGITARPVRDALSRFQVSRGGIQYRPPMDALAMSAGLGAWTATDDAAVSNPPDGTPEKTCAVIECPSPITAVVDAIYLCLQFPNFTARFDPEWVDANERAALIAHARFAENRLLTKLFTGSKRLVSAAAVSATRDVLVAIDKAVAYYRNVHRLDTMVPLRMILPRWVLDMFRADLCRSLGSAYDTATLGVADSLILTFFRNRGVNVTFHLDGLAAQDLGAGGASAEDIPAQFYASASAGAVIPPFIDKIDSLLFAEGDWLYLDGGTLDLGLVRDSQLNAINRYQTFIESWEGVAFNGVESLRLVMSVQPSGAVVGTLDPTGTGDFTD